MIANVGQDAASWSWQFNTSAAGIQAHLNGHPEDRLLDLDQYIVGQRSYQSAVYIRNVGAHARTWWYHMGIAVHQIDAVARVRATD